MGRQQCRGERNHADPEQQKQVQGKQPVVRPPDVIEQPAAISLVVHGAANLGQPPQGLESGTYTVRLKFENQNPGLQTFPVPALRKVREGQGTPRVGDSKARPPAIDPI